MLDAFFSSTAAVAIAEIGDKTQLLALLLISRYRQPWTISLGVFLATLVNHGLSAWLGAFIAQWIPPGVMPWLVAGSFLAVGLWLLVPDKDDEDSGQFAHLGALMATLVLFFLAEIGDKTQIATVILAAKFPQATLEVITGTTTGMLLANVPVIFAGGWLMQKMPLQLARRAAFVLFMALAAATLVGGVWLQQG